MMIVDQGPFSRALVCVPNLKSMLQTSRICVLAFSLCVLCNVHCSTDKPRENFRRVTTAPAGTIAVITDAGSGPDGSGPDGSGPDGSGNDAPDAHTDDEDASTAVPDASVPQSAVDEAVLAACGEPPRVAGDFTRERLRGASADCAVWHYCAFQTVAQTLAAATEAYLADRSPVQLSAARAAYRDAMRVWSRAELFQFGPAASSSMSAGKDNYQGKGLRDRIYAWPATARCRVEEEILDQVTNVSSVLISGRGLFAIEYSLFYEGTDTACAAAGTVAQRWSQLSVDELRTRKAAYANAVARDVRQQVADLIAAWAADGGNFKPVFLSASGYPNEQEAMNVLGWALIYIEREVKDWKVGIPAGYTMTAPVTGPETPYALMSTETIRANLRGFRSLFQGCAADGSGLGFDDWLIEAGHGELADEIIAAYGEAQATLDASPSLDRANAAELETDYQALRKLTNLLKGDLFGAGSPINLKLPASVEGDTD